MVDDSYSFFISFSFLFVFFLILIYFIFQLFQLIWLIHGISLSFNIIYLFRFPFRRLWNFKINNNFYNFTFRTNTNWRSPSSYSWCYNYFFAIIFIISIINRKLGSLYKNLLNHTWEIRKITPYFSCYIITFLFITANHKLSIARTLLVTIQENTDYE